MAEKPTYEELEQRVKQLEQAEFKRKKAEKALQESEDQYRGIMADTPVLICRFLPGGEITFVNKAYCEYFDKTYEELVSSTFLSLIPEADLETVMANISALTVESPMQSHEHQVIAPGGDICWQRWTNRALFDAQGKVIAYQSIGEDITDRVRTEEDLRESESKYKTLINNIPGMIYRAYSDWSVEVISGSEVICDYADKEFNSKEENWLSIIHHDDKERVREEGFELTQVQKDLVQIYRIITKSGDICWIEDRETSLFSEEGEFKWIDGIVFNITERKQSEDALRVSEEKYRGLFDESIAATYVFDEKKNFLDSNQAGVGLLGYSREELLNMSISDVDADPIVVVPAHEQLLGGDRIINYEHQLKRKDGKVITVLNNSRPITDTDGHVIGMQSTLIDITARKQAEEDKKKLEELIQQAQRLEAIGTLAGGIAHDFNNLLMAIQGNTSLLLYDMESCHPHFNALENIEKSVRNGAKLTNQLLGYARKGKYQVKLVNLNQLVEETADTIGRTRKEIIIRRELSEDLFAIEAEQGQIEQVLWNLYINAADSMPGGGKIIIKTLNLTHEDMRSKLYDPKPGNYVQLTVTDTGKGMDKRTQERIFEPFFTTKEMGRGTGLGLASVYGIVKSHGGYIEIASEKGHGTTFTIFLPACSKDIPKTIKSSDRIIEGNGTILLVDDEEIVLETGVKMLERLGYSVIKAGSGIEAVEVYKDNKEAIDLVILDMIMPDVGGGETYDKMKKINPIVKVLLSSGYSVDGQATEILKRGCKDFIQKPFNLQKLSGKIKEILINQ
jgi:PAS domain S-box-containing protein